MTMQKDYYDQPSMAYESVGQKVDQSTAEYNALGATSTEACANCLFFISPNCCTVVQDWPVPISPTGHSRYWTAIPVAQADAIRVVIVSEEDDGMVKAVWDSAYVSDLPDSSFAVISAGGDKDDEGKTTPRSLRHLPYKNAAGDVDLPHLRNALARLSQTTLTAAERATAKRRLDAAARAAGVGDEGKGLIDRIVSGLKARFSSPVTTTLRAAQQTGAPASANGDKTDAGAFRLYKEADGGYRWLALVSNKYRDRDNKENGPEIIEEAAHVEYVAYLDKTGDYPEAWLWHVPGTRWGRADWADYADGFLVMSGTVDKGMEDVAAALEGQALGVSHGFYQKYADQAKGIIGWYRTFEVSALPPEAAANPWTALAVIQKEAGMALDSRKRAFIEDKLGRDRVAALEGDLLALGKALQAAGVEYKDLLTAGLEADTPVEKSGDDDGGPALSLKDVADTLEKALAPTVTALAGLSAAVVALDARVKAMERLEDEKFVDLLTAKSSATRRTAGFQASKEGGVDTDKDDMKDAKPGVSKEANDWLRTAMLPL